MGIGIIIGMVVTHYIATGIYPPMSQFIVDEIVSRLHLYVYMGISTIVILMLAGFFIGKLQDRLQDRLVEQSRSLDLANHDLNQLMHLHAESEEKYRQAIDQASDAILFVEIETGQVFDANTKATELTGYTRTQLCRFRIWDLYPPGDIEKMRTLFKRAQVVDVTIPEDLTFVREDGERFDIEVRASIIEYKKTRAIQQIWHDVTERKCLERQLRHADRLASIGRLASGIAHEVGNPLGSVSAYAQILLMGGESEEERIEYLRAIESESTRIGELLKHLLNFSRPTADHVEWVEINYVIERALNLVSAQKKSRAIKITKRLDTPSPKVKIDPDQLEQVLINLLLNAADAMPDEGELTARSYVDSQFAFVAITDTGIGINPVDRDRIFDPFFTTKSEGTGLGLAMSAKLVEKYGGLIECQSEEGKGSTFTIVLPQSLETVRADGLTIEVEPEDQSVWSFEYPQVGNLKTLPLTEHTEGGNDGKHQVER